jgi:hypothetical protein
MSVPTHNLYDFVHQVTEKKFSLMYYSPWGSRLYENVILYLSDEIDINGTHGLDYRTVEKFTKNKKYLPVVLCHDQEPLNYDLHSSDKAVKEYISMKDSKLSYLYPEYNDLNIAFKIYHSWQEKWILLHSELNSHELNKYMSTGHFVGAYWWCHALLARDWYRYAEHDFSLSHQVDNKKLFLIYSRDHSGSRSYRSLLVELIKQRISSESYQIGSFDGKPVSSDASARYNSEDFVRTDISLILETIADQRVHLTEKTLRPIACGHPFILMAGPGSLATLRKYGFETFSPWIDESYDNEIDQGQRIKMIVEEMHRIEKLSKFEKNLLISRCKDIAQKNRKLFFSSIFQNYIVQELKDNINSAYKVTKGKIDYELIKQIHSLRDHTHHGWRNLIT